MADVVWHSFFLLTAPKQGKRLHCLLRARWELWVNKTIRTRHAIFIRYNIFKKHHIGWNSNFMFKNHRRSDFLWLLKANFAAAHCSADAIGISPCPYLTSSTLKVPPPTPLLICCFFFLFQSTLLSFLASSDKFLIVFIEHNSMKHFWCLSVSAQSYIYLPCVPCEVLSGKNIPLKTASVLPDIEVRWTAPFADVQCKPFHTLLAKCHIGPFVASQTYISAGLLADKFFALF